MKRFVFFVLLGIGLVLCFNFYEQRTKTITNIVKNQDEFSIDNPPRESLKGKVKTMTGKVLWESRIATVPAQIDKPITIQQGERLLTDIDATATVEFDKIVSFEMSSSAEASIVQTLPGNFVFVQPLGKIKYLKLGKIPISITTLHLLTIINEGEIIIDVNEKQITIMVINGSVTIAYNDSSNISNVKTIEKNQQFIFDDDLREAKIED